MDLALLGTDAETERAELGLKEFLGSRCTSHNGFLHDPPRVSIPKSESSGTLSRQRLSD